MTDEIDDYQKLHDRYRTEQWLADSWHDRQRRCNAMLRTINQIKLNELERRIKADAKKEILLEKSPSANKATHADNDRSADSKPV